MDAGVDSTLGAILIGSWVNVLFYMLEITQIVTFFNLFPKERTGIKMTVLSAFAIDTFATGAICACVYEYCVTHWGDRAYAAGQHFGIPIYVATSGWSAFIMQIFLVWRYYAVSKNVVVTTLISAVVATQISGCMITTAFLVKYNSYEDRLFVVTPATIWLVSTACADILVAAALLWELRSMKTSYTQTKSIIRRITATVISTGSVTALIATAVLLAYLLRKEENITVGIGFVLGRICSLTTLVSLNSRVRHRPDGDSSGSQNVGQWQAERTRPDAYDLGVMASRGEGIAVHQTAVVHIDDDNKTEFSRRDSDSHITSPTAKVKNL